MLGCVVLFHVHALNSSKTNLQHRTEQTSVTACMPSVQLHTIRRRSWSGSRLKSGLQRQTHLKEICQYAAVPLADVGGHWHQLLSLNSMFTLLFMDTWPLLFSWFWNFKKNIKLSTNAPNSLSIITVALQYSAFILDDRSYNTQYS